MCGIIGVATSHHPPAAGILQQALQALAHRGPDAEGVFQEGPVALGHRRLAILDLSPTGAQPMQDETGRYVLIYNGEVFNYQTLRHQLQQAGVSFRSTSDTEVVLQLLIRKGVECLNSLNGFFALAFYDRQTQHLLLARDRYGIKPLLLYQQEGWLAFGSELKALLALGIPRKLDMLTVAEYFQFNYVPPHTAILQGVTKLPPGHYALWQPNAALTQQAYYSLPTTDQDYNAPPGDYQTQQQQLVTLLDEAVKLRLVADVPVGVFLSGGIDSSIITALAARHQRQLHTFSIAFEDPLFDESNYAQLVARMYGTQHTAFKLSNAALYEHLYAVLDAIDEPFADASALNFYVLSQLTRGKVTVALSGDGADELLGGYQKHVGEYQARRSSPRNTLLRLGYPLLKALPGHRNSKLGRRLWQLQKYASGLSQGAVQRYLSWASLLDEAQLNNLLVNKVDAEVLQGRYSQYTQGLTEGGSMNEVLGADMRLVLPGDMLTKVDLMSMANSLEVRVPFLDYNVVDFALNLPASYKVQGSQRKRILQDAFKAMLPPQLYQRPKQGFEVPLRSWFLGPLRQQIEQELLDKDFIQQQGIFRYAGLQQLWQTILAGRNAKQDWTLWAVLVFQHSYKKYLT